MDGCLNINWTKATKILLLITSVRDMIFFLFLYVYKTSTELFCNQREIDTKSVTDTYRHTQVWATDSWEK